MKSLLLVIISLLTFGCANHSVIDLTTATVQQHDLQDLDSDGVVEVREKCADTHPGATIDNYGCGKVNRTDDSMALAANFANDSSVVNTADYEKIKEVADFMSKYPDSHVTIEGHCSVVGSRAYNQKLSEERAAAVAQILTNRYDIAPFRVAAVGFGFDKPIDPNDSKEAHAKNRRIVATLKGTAQSVDMKWTIYTVDED